MHRHDADEAYLSLLVDQLRRDQISREIHCKWRRPLFRHDYSDVVNQEGIVTGTCCMKCGKRRYV